MFGSEAWAHNLDENWEALQPKSDKYIFIEYSEDVKGYRLLQPKYNDMIIRIDVNLVKISWLAILIQRPCHIRIVIHIQRFFHSLPKLYDYDLIMPNSVEVLLSSPIKMHSRVLISIFVSLGTPL